jgi:peptidoglycan/LPS O-acetylase OafA/YrhL
MYAIGWALVNVAGAVIVAHLVLSTDSFVTRGLSRKSIAWVGKRSYGAYLFHLPVFAVLTHARVPLPFYPLFALRVVVTMLLAAASFRWVEMYFLRRKKYPSKEQTREPVEDVPEAPVVPAPAA